MGQYQIHREFYTDDARFEPGESDLAGLSEAEKADVVANGWATPLGDAPPPPPVEAETAPLALPHYEGAGDPPPGTWEYVWKEQAAAAAAPVQDEPSRKRRKSEE